MRISLKSSARTLTFGCCAILGVAGYMYLSTRAVRAHAWAGGIQQQEIEHAIALEPRNAEYRFKLGNWHALIDQDYAAAQSAYKEAVQQNPHTAAYYLEVARLGLFANDRRQIADALENALRVDPTTPSVNWQAANIYLAANDLDHALPLFRSASALSVEYRSSAATLCWQATHDVDRMVAYALPSDAEAYGNFLRYLVLQHETAAADKLWEHILKLHRPESSKTSFVYFDSLLNQHRVADAVRSWQALADISPEIASYQPQDGNLIVNSGFEQSILNGGFGWRITPSDKVTAEVATEGGYQGTHSLSVNFDTATAGTAGVFQLIPVEPDSSYTLSLDYKTEELESAHGISATVSDAFTNQQISKTEEMSGSTPWREIGQTFHTGPSTMLVALEFKRPEGTLIRGKIMIDNVRVVKK